MDPILMIYTIAETKYESPVNGLPGKEEIESTVTTNIQLTSFADNSEYTRDNVIDTDGSFDRLDPYEDQGLEKVLQRVYRVADLSWGQELTVGDAFSEITFPRVLFAEPNIATKLNNFRYLKGDIRVAIRLNGTDFSYGKLLIGYMPVCPKSTSPNYPLGNIYRASCINHVVVSANTSGVVDFMIPFCLPLQYIDLKNINDYIESIGVVRAFVLNPLRSSSPTDTSPLSVTVFANFENIEIAGLTSHSYVTPVANALRKRRVTKKAVLYAEAQSESRQKSEDGIISGIAERVGTISSFFSRLPIVGGVAGTIAGGSHAVASFARRLGLDKPTSVATQQFLSARQANHFPGCSGLDYSIPLSAKPDLLGPDSTNIFRCAQDETNLDYIKQLPSLVRVFSFDSTTDIDKSITRVPVTPSFSKVATTNAVGYNAWYLSNSAFAAAPYLYWRGTMKYTLTFSCSKFTTARIRILWLPDDYIDQGYVLDTSDGDLVSRIVDVTGDTSVSFSIPYLSHVPYSAVGMPAMDPAPYGKGIVNGTVHVLLVNPVRTQDSEASSIIYCNIFSSADADMQFIGPSNLMVPTFQNAPPPLAEVEAEPQSTRDVFIKPFAGLIDASRVTATDPTTDEVVSFTELFHRYTLYSLNPKDFYTYANGTDSYFDFVRASYVGWRGSMRFATTSSTGHHVVGTVTPLVTNPNTPDPVLRGKCQPQMFNSTSFNSVSDVQMPFYSPYRYLPTIPDSMRFPLAASPVQIPTFNYVENTMRIAVGDDFVMGQYLGPPTAWYYAVSSNQAP